MAQLQGSHEGFDYEAFWNVQDQTVFWGAVISHDGHVAGRPKGQLRRAALEGDAAEAVRKVVLSAIDKGVDIHSEEHPKLRIPDA